MSRLSLPFAVALALSALPLMAQPPAKPTASASAAPAASGSAAPEGELPPGHPPTGDMPPGHPPTEEGGGMFRPPPDQVAPDENLPRGTIAITIADADDKPIAGATILIAVKEESVSRGEKTTVLEHKADANGRLRLDDMKYGTGVGYTIKTKLGEATFETQQFGLQDQHGMHVRLHAYESVTELAEAPLVMEAVVMLEIKEDSFSINHRIRTLNIGRKAFVSKGVRMRLPDEYKAFNIEDEEGGGSIRMVERDGFAELEGTFPPGQAEFFFRYQIPLDGGSTQKLRVPLPPRVVHTTVVAGAGPEMSLEVSGFPKAKPERWHNGQRVLSTVHQPDLRMGLQPLLADMTPRILDITLTGIPTPGPWRWFALALAVAGTVGGSAYFYVMRKRKVGLSKEERRDLREARDALLDEIARLEELHRTGEVGPRSYERLRAALLDALARIVHKLEEDEARHPYRGKVKKSTSSEDKRPKRKRKAKRKIKSATA